MRHYRLPMWILLLAAWQSATAQRAVIQVVDEATSRGIPLVELETILSTRYVTDSNGIAVIDEPALQGRELFVKPFSHGYSYRAPGLAMGGFSIKMGGESSTTIVMQRDMIAERLYRITGAGIYGDSLVAGVPYHIKEPMLNGGVAGQDSALCTEFGGRLFWIWGDTTNLRHPLAANFRSTAAFSDFPTSGGLAVENGINLEYITEGNFAKPMMPKREGKEDQVYWISCLMTVPDKEGREHLLAWWNRIRGAEMKTIERGLAEFDPSEKEFRYLDDHPTTAVLQPGGHAVRAGDYMIFTDYGKQTRVRATYEAARDPSQYEALTCLEKDGPFTTAGARVRRDEDGRVVYEWRRGVEPTGYKEQKALVESGVLKESECLYRPIDGKNGKPFLPHSCSIAWNGYRKKWTMVTSELMGASMLGEAWYLEADRPEGPWVNGVKVVTHKNYSLYNPLQHPELARDKKHVYFEGTYTKTFSGNDVGTPYYDYNQVMFRIDLDDARLAPARVSAEVKAVVAP